MKNLVRFAVAGLLVTGYQTVQAQALPSSDASDLWLFVSDQAAGTTFAEDTGIPISSLLPTGSLTAGSVLSTAISANINLPASTALSTYISTNGAANLEWGIEAFNMPGTATGTGFKKAGGLVGLTDNDVSQETNTSNLQLANLESWAQGFQGDITYLAATYTAGGTSYKFSNGSAGGNVWGSTGPGNQGGSTNIYGNGPDQSGIGLGTSEVFYGLTGNGNTGQVQSYILSTGLELSANGTLETAGGGGTTVPIPAALWLFGSGLLGLAGVGRRRGGGAVVTAAAA
jgi:hypothetical protein